MMTRGIRKRGFLDAKWTERCNKPTAEDSRFLLEYDKLKSGMELVLGTAEYIINPFQAICPICGEIRILNAMRQIRPLCQHIKEKNFHDAKGKDSITRLEDWKTKNFITSRKLTEKVP